MHFAKGTDAEASINKAIAVPKFLTSEDGRKFSIIHWNANVALDEAVVIQVKCYVEVEDGIDKTKRSITCDGCKKELIEDTSYPHRWGLRLSAQDYGVNTSGMVYANICYPPIDRDHHFCGLKCLKEWASR